MRNSEYWKIRREYENSIGFKMYGIIRNLNIYLIFVERNLKEVLNGIDYYEKNHHKLWAIKDILTNKRDLDEFMVEFLRLLFNYLMAVKSLHDKSIIWRNHLNKRYGNRIDKELYNQKLNEYKVLNYGDFLNKIRNELTHESEKGGFKHVSFSAGFEKDKGDWAKIIFNRLETEVKEVILTYNKSITMFHTWFINKLKESFDKEINEALSLNKQVLRMQGTPYT